MNKTISFLQNYGVVLAFAILVVVNLVFRGPSFLAVDNLRNIISQGSFVGIIAIGMTLVIISGGIDLAVGSLVVLSAAAGMLFLNKLSGGAATSAIMQAGIVSILVGTCAGFLNGVIIAYARVAPFIVTLAGLAAYRSIALVLGDGGEIRSLVPSFQDVGFGGVGIPFAKTNTGEPVVLYWSAILFFALAILAHLLLTKTKFGRYVIAVGANEAAARYSAISIPKIKIAVYTILGSLVGLSSFFLAARMNSVGTGSVGLFYELDAIASVVIGGTSLRGGKGRIWGTVIGVILLTLISNMLTAFRVDTDWQGTVRGLVILVAVLMQGGAKETR